MEKMLKRNKDENERKKEKIKIIYIYIKSLKPCLWRILLFVRVDEAAMIAPE